MSSEPTPDESIDDIIGGAAATEGAGATLSAEDLKALADKVELLTADFGRWESYKAASSEYITEFTAEIQWHRRIRFAVAIACACLVLFLTAVLVVALCWANTLFAGAHAHALTALIVATVTGSVVVTIAAIKGAFQTTADRNVGLPMPDHMKEIVEAAKTVVGQAKG